MHHPDLCTLFIRASNQFRARFLKVRGFRFAVWEQEHVPGARC